MHSEDIDLHELRVEIQGQPEGILYGYSVRVLDLLHQMDAGHTYSESGSIFTVRGLPEGDYRLQVKNAVGEVVREERVRVNQTVSFVRINLAGGKKPRPSEQVVSVTQLRHPPPRQAVKAFEAARKHSDAKEPEKAIEELQKAVRISPEFAAAHTNLAANYLRLQQYEQAIEAANRALEIAGPNVADLCNRALGLWGFERYEESMESARQALRLNGDAPTAHFILGSLLAIHPETRREGIEHLERVADKNPTAAKNLKIARAALE